ncbi:MAG: penicillin-binding protein activator LpoB [Vibrionaceae bacterium]
MFKLGCLLLGLTVLITGCAPQVVSIEVRNDPPKKTAPVVSKPSTSKPDVVVTPLPPAPLEEKNDLRSSARLMVEKMVKDSANAALLSKKPVVVLETVKNNTAEQIDVVGITKSINTALAKSGKFQFVDLARVEGVRAQLNLKSNDALVNPETAIQFGKMVGAQYMFYGDVSQETPLTNTAGSSYLLHLRLMELNSGLIEWSDESVVKNK